MSVKKEPSGRRSVQVEVEVPGTVEEVWAAIATGPGVSSWFVPTEMKDGMVTSNFGPGMESQAKVIAWEPPHRFSAESNGLGPNAPAMATEWTVEARSGGKCLVRVVHSLFASTDDWDDQLNSIESGWPTFFEVLRMYLQYFRGLPSSIVQVLGCAKGTTSQAWELVTTKLGLAGAKPGTRWTAPSSLPAVAGIVEKVVSNGHYCGLIRLDAPVKGIALLNVPECGGAGFVGITFYLYGDDAKLVAARDQATWEAWMQENFPMAAPGQGNVA